VSHGPPAHAAKNHFVFRAPAFVSAPFFAAPFFVSFGWRAGVSASTTLSFHRAAAAFFAISERCSGVSVFERVLAPFLPSLEKYSEISFLFTSYSLAAKHKNSQPGLLTDA
jgi:hypothetical protein